MLFWYCMLSYTISPMCTVETTLYMVINEFNKPKEYNCHILILPIHVNFTWYLLIKHKNEFCAFLVFLCWSNSNVIIDKKDSETHDDGSGNNKIPDVQSLFLPR